MFSLFSRKFLAMRNIALYSVATFNHSQDMGKRKIKTNFVLGWLKLVVTTYKTPPQKKDRVFSLGFLRIYEGNDLFYVICTMKSTYLYNRIWSSYDFTRDFRNLHSLFVFYLFFILIFRVLIFYKIYRKIRSSYI